MLGLAGACAIITIGHAAGADAAGSNFLRFCGEHSIVIYLAFFLPMAATRTLLLKTGIIPDIGTVSLIVTIVGVAGALADLARWRSRCAPTSCSSGRPRSGSRRRRPGRRCRRRSSCIRAGSPRFAGDDSVDYECHARAKNRLPRLSIAAKIPKLRPCRNQPPKPPQSPTRQSRRPSLHPRRPSKRRQGRPRLPGRRLLLHFPRLSRAAAAEPQVRRAAGQRRARLLQHAVEAAARHARGQPADASRHRLRQVGRSPSATSSIPTTRRTGRRRPTT